MEIGIIVNVFKKQKRESHNDGVLFLYTAKISQVHFLAEFCPCESKDRATLHNGTYTQLDWYSHREQKRAAFATPRLHI